MSKGFYVEPKKDCPHITQFYLAEDQKIAKTQKCTTCEDESENWCCLTCGHRYCSRYVAGHMEQHFLSEGHPIAVSYSDFSFWCYECDDYITHRRFKPLLAALAEAKFGDEEVTYFEDWRAAHGHGGDINWPLPAIVTKSHEFARKDQKNLIKANEFLDSPDVLALKIDMLANMIKQSKYMITYTGAGLSRSSGIPDYATKNSTIITEERIKDPFDAAPTLSHHILKRMADAGYLKYWVQQNHDGLPQKAGYPQEMINEIHGAWFDPSNPVVAFSGNLRGDLFADMIHVENKSDMCLCLGTSLSGMNADRVAITPAKKYFKSPNDQFGTIIINLQQTPLDGSASLRIWAKLDDAFRLLAEKLNLDTSTPPYPLPSPPFEGREEFWVPYDATGNLNRNVLMKLSLEEGEKVQIVNTYASNCQSIGFVYGRRNDHNWTISLFDKEQERRNYTFGWWWIDAALRGSVPSLPFVNINPTIRPAGTN